MPKNSTSRRKRSEETFAKVQDYKEVFNTEAGKKVLLDLMREGHVISNTFQGDPHEMVYAEGRRSIVLFILQIINTDMATLKERIEQANEQGVKGYV